MREIEKIGFVGLGVMGGPMAVNMKSKGGEEVIAYDASPETMKKYAEGGLTLASAGEQVCAGDVVFLSLPDGSVVEKVLFGAGGLYEHLKEGQILVDLSTIKYSTTLTIEGRCSERGVKFLDAPVSGMGARAVEGTLAVMCGGEEAVFEKVRPYFERIGTNIQYMGKVGSGQLTKLINQLLFDINIAALAEILPFAQKMGLAPDKIESIVNSGTGRSFASEFFAPRILRNKFDEGYPLSSAYKDLESAGEISSSMNLPLPVLSAATTTYQMALLKGYGKQDKGAMVRVFEELFGVAFRSQGA